MSIVKEELMEKADDLSRELLFAIKSNQKERVKEIINIFNHPELKKYKFFNVNNTAVNHFGDNTYPVLHAAEYSNYEILKMLIDAGASLQVTDRHGENIFNIIANRSDIYYSTLEEKYAFEDQKLEMLKLIIREGYDLEKKDNCGNTAIQIAVRSNDIRIFDLVMAYEPNVNTLNNSRETPLFLAVYKNDGYKTQKLIKAGAKLDVTKSELKSACINGNLEITEALVNAGADLNPSIEYEHSPLYYSRNGHNKNKDIEHLLLSKGAKDKEQLEAETPVRIRIAKAIGEKFNQISNKIDDAKTKRDKAKLEKNEAIRKLNELNLK